MTLDDALAYALKEAADTELVSELASTCAQPR